MSGDGRILGGQDLAGRERMAAARLAAQPAARARLEQAETIDARVLARRLAADVTLDDLDQYALNHEGAAPC